MVMLFFKKVLTPLLLFCFTLFIFILFAGRLKFSFPVTPFNYFSYLAEAFLHGSLSLVSFPSTIHDLSLYGGKIYLNWGPASALLVIPFIKLFGLNISDTLYTAIIASLTPLALWIVLYYLDKFYLQPLSTTKKVILYIFFTFGTINFYISVSGSVWFTEQTFAIFYLLFALAFIFKFLHSGFIKDLIFSSILVNLAILSRLTLVFYVPFFLTIIFIRFLKEKYSYLLFFHQMVILITITVIFLSIYGLYNNIRFNSFLETGLTYHNYYKPKFEKDIEKFGFFNLNYIPRNFHYMVLNIPSVKKDFPFFNFDYMGNSIFFISPMLLLTTLIFLKKYWHKRELALFNTSVVLWMFATILIPLMVFGTGWVQFGYRYALDIMPFFIFLLAEVINDIPIFLILPLLLISILLNTLGVVWFLGIHF